METLRHRRNSMWSEGGGSPRRAWTRSKAVVRWQRKSGLVGHWGAYDLPCRRYEAVTGLMVLRAEGSKVNKCPPFLNCGSNRWQQQMGA